MLNSKEVIKVQLDVARQEELVASNKYEDGLITYAEYSEFCTITDGLQNEYDKLDIVEDLFED